MSYCGEATHDYQIKEKAGAASACFPKGFHVFRGLRAVFWHLPEAFTWDIFGKVISYLEIRFQNFRRRLPAFYSVRKKWQTHMPPPTLLMWLPAFPLFTR